MEIWNRNRVPSEDKKNTGRRRWNLRNVLKDKIWMIRNKRAYGAIGMAGSIPMMMECESHYAKKQINEEEVNKFLIHHSIRTEPLLFSKKTINKQYYNVLKLRRSTIFRQILHHIARVNPMSINGQYTPWTGHPHYFITSTESAPLQRSRRSRRNGKWFGSTNLFSRGTKDPRRHRPQKQPGRRRRGRRF